MIFNPVRPFQTHAHNHYATSMPVHLCEKEIHYNALSENRCVVRVCVRHSICACIHA